MSKIWIRHVEKLYKNGKGDIYDKTQFQHDPGIKIEEDTYKKVENLVLKLMLKYGPPKYIYCSPFLRTRETMNLIIHILDKKYNIHPVIFYKSEIAEYLGFCKRIDHKEKADLHPDTKKFFNFTIFLGESLNHFKERVFKHFEEIKDLNDNIWVITHGIVISNIFNFYNSFNIERPSPLDYIVLNNKTMYKE
jgi:broad specificity phosphatase PhoE